jgi:VanZ family protein
MIVPGPVFAMLALIGLVWMVDRAFGGSQPRRSALEILDERFAKGEIDRTEYEDAVEGGTSSTDQLTGSSSQLVVRIAAWSLAATILVLSLVPSDLRPETGLPHKLEHLLIFAATGAAFGLGYEVKRGLLVIQLVIFAGAVEIAQLFVPGRHARLSDFLVDAVAICAGSIAGSWAKAGPSAFDIDSTIH